MQYQEKKCAYLPYMLINLCMMHKNENSTFIVLALIYKFRKESSIITKENLDNLLM